MVTTLIDASRQSRTENVALNCTGQENGNKEEGEENQRREGRSKEG